MEKPDALTAPITTFANAGEGLVAQVIRGAGEINRIEVQDLTAPAGKPHLLDRQALTLTCPFPDMRDHLLEGAGWKRGIRGREFRDAENEAALWSRRRTRQPD